MRSAYPNARFASRSGCSPIRRWPLGCFRASISTARDRKARLTRWARFARYNKPRGERAAADYVALARQHKLDPAQMALAFVTGRDFVTSNIIGAATMAQLESNIDSTELTLSAELIEAISTIHEDNPDPAHRGRSSPLLARLGHRAVLADQTQKLTGSLFAWIGEDVTGLAIL